MTMFEFIVPMLALGLGVAAIVAVKIFAREDENTEQRHHPAE